MTDPGNFPFGNHDANFLMGQYLATNGVFLGPCAKGGWAGLDWTGDTFGYKKIIYILAT